MLAEIYAPVQGELDAATERLCRELGACDPQLRALVEHASHYGGKRLRPALLLLCGRACGPLGDRHILAAAVVELVHTATLVHDDVIDDAERRRRGATVNARFGPEVSILLGDLLFARALELFARVATPAEHRLLGHAVREVCEGELLQLLASRQPALDEARYLQLIGKKTGALCGVACSLGAALAGEGDGALERFGRFGRRLGIAFQIADDVLDIRGDERVAGKTLGLDLLGGRLTLPIIHVRESGPEAARQQLEALLAEPRAQGLRERLAAFLAERGAFAYCERTAREFVERATAELAFLDERPECQSLFALADFVVRRDC